MPGHRLSCCRPFHCQSVPRTGFHQSSLCCYLDRSSGHMRNHAWRRSTSSENRHFIKYLLLFFANVCVTTPKRILERVSFDRVCVCKVWIWGTQDDKSGCSQMDLYALCRQRWEVHHQNGVCHCCLIDRTEGIANTILARKNNLSFILCIRFRSVFVSRSEVLVQGRSFLFYSLWSFGFLVEAPI